MSKKKSSKNMESEAPTPKKRHVRVKVEHIQHVRLRQSQERYSKTIEDSDVTFCHGPAGTSKTFTACYTALKMLAEKKIKQVILCKPIQESGEKLGFLPGSIKDKVDPYMQSYVSNLKKIVGEEITERLLEREVIVFKPLAYMRGDTFDDCLMILDEAQNATFKQLMLFITRMGKTSKTLITGDVSQYDIPKRSAGLPGFIKLMDGIKGVENFEFTEDDIVRAEILKKIVNKYDMWKADNE
jgi:phosphate starvation-inducible protein PhoH and related proteins